MAVDTKQKRFAMSTFGDSTPSALMFEVDGTVDADDRRHLLGLYLTLSEAAGIDIAGLCFKVPDTRLHFQVPDNRLMFKSTDDGS